jgi:hypothetical protein
LRQPGTRSCRCRIRHPGAQVRLSSLRGEGALGSPDHGPSG